MKTLLTRNPFRALLAVLGMLMLALTKASAQTSSAADPTTLTATATTAFYAVTTLVVAMVGFYIIVRIVKGIRK